MKCRLYYALFLLLLTAIITPLTPVPSALAQPPITPLTQPANAADVAADNKAYQEVLRHVQTLGNNPEQAVAAWQQLLQARPNMTPMVGYKAIYSLAQLQVDALKNPEAALTTYDEGLKKYPDSTGTLLLAAEKARILTQLDRVGEAETALQPFWSLALSSYFTNPGPAQTLSRAYLRGYVQVLEQQNKHDEIITRLRSALLTTPTLLTAHSLGQGDGWIYEALVTRLLAKKQFDEALSWAKLRFAVADYNWEDTGNAVTMLTRVWMAKEGADAPSLRAFMASQEDPNAANPLTTIKLPELPAAQKAQLMAYNGYPNDVINALILSGAPKNALLFAYKRAIANPREPTVLHTIARIFKAEDLNTRRANDFIANLQTGTAVNPLEDFLQQMDAMPTAPEGAAPEADDIKAFEELKAKLAEQKADANAMIAEYTQFYELRPALHHKVAVKVTEAVVQLYALQLKNPEKAKEINWWGWGKFQQHPDVLRLVVAERKFRGNDPLPAPLQIQKLQKGGAAPAANTNTVQPPPAAPAAGAPVIAQAPPVPAEAGIVTVSNTEDKGPGSLRQALLDAGSTPGTTVRFNIPITDPNFRDGVFTIVSVTPLPAVKAAGTMIDGSTQTAFTGDTNKAGPEIVLQSSPGSRGRHGLYINAPNCVVKSLVLNSIVGSVWRFAIQITGPGAIGNKVIGCYIGVDPTGTKAMENAIGVQFDAGANSNTIGGTTSEARNIIAGNNHQIFITGTGTSGNIVQGNYIGTSAEGEAAFPVSNAITIERGANNNLIGGAVAGAGNLIVGNGEQASAIRISGKDSNGNIIQGNLIGTNKTGTKSIATSGFGILVLNNVENTQIGGTTPTSGNLIVGNSSSGIQLSFNKNNIAQGNYIGCDVTGKTVLGNSVGLTIYASAGNTIGGAIPGAANVIGGSRKDGIVILGEDEPAPASNNIVQGNFIGVGTDGKTALANGEAGIRISGIAHNNIIGLAADGTGAGNTIAFNKGRDVLVQGDEKNTPTGNVIGGNKSHDNGA